MALKSCKECRNEISSDAKKCPQCGKDQRNWIMRHKVLSAIGILLLLIIISSASNNKDSKTVSQINTTAPMQTEKPLEKLGAVSNVVFQVVDSKTTETVGENQYLRKSADGVFKIIHVLVKNQQNDAITIDANNFKLIDSQNREFSHSSEGSTYFGVDKTFFLKNINPGVIVDGYLVFDVPKDAAGFKLKARGGMTGRDIYLKVD